MRTLQPGFAVLIIGILVPCVFSSTPSWWTTRSVLNSDATDDYAAANVGQLKYIASKAAAELSTQLSAGEETNFTKLVDSWNLSAPSGVVRDDYAALTQGQLKAVAALFYDHLTSAGYYGAPLKPYARYPWTVSTSDDDDYAVVNLGQLKYVFSFSATNYVPAGFSTDSDSDGIPDWWEIERALNKDNAADALLINGGLTNFEIYQGTQSTGGDPASANLVGLITFTP